MPAFATGHVTVYCGDVLAVLRELPAESVDCCVTSPPYWGLRDYGTATWDGGSAECGHVVNAAPVLATDPGIRASTLDGGKKTTTAQASTRTFRDTCPKCGARRIDSQIGLEPTPDAYVAVVVEVFREVRRVLRPQGTLWLNLGDSYGTGTTAARKHGSRGIGAATQDAQDAVGRVGGMAKQMMGIPWRVAFALQADGWYLRSDIIWAKPNPMPESVTDRPTKAHEYVFLLSKSPTYYFDQDAVREPVAREWDDSIGGSLGGTKWLASAHIGGDTRELRPVAQMNPAGRNIRSVWTIATQPYPEAHFATFPRALPERCINAGCPEQVCSTCGKPRERITERDSTTRVGPTASGWREAGARASEDAVVRLGETTRTTIGWTDCGHGTYVSGTVLDPFAGSGTTLAVARDLGRKSIGIELNTEYVRLIEKRCAQTALDLGA